MAISAEVELDLFSGRPNPVWTLSNADTTELERRLSALPKTSAKTLFDGLGYRGLIVRRSKEATAHVQNGVVALASHESSTYLEDSQRALERWLIATGKSAIGAEIYKMVEAEASK